ncbi:MAG TPA: hypothetical protein DDX84_07820 [Nitrospiraceae bacterium]|nr:MAG: hypothetical protein A2035_02875 [Nitrospirae bacterium GWA2_42_11]HBI24091.1 hypothetical protein [Nitrospiraceae bacterium]
MKEIKGLLHNVCLSEAIKAICKKYGIEALYVFGSRSDEIFDRIYKIQDKEKDKTEEPLSDVDIGILPIEGIILDVQKKVRLIAELEDVFLVMRVDLVVLTEASIFLALEIIRGKLVYDANPDRTAEYELYVMRHAGDIYPFEQYRLKQIITKGAL